MLNILAAFLVVFGLMFGLLFLIRFMQHKKWFVKFGLQSQNIEILDSLVLDQKHRVIWMRHQSDGYLILLGQNQDLILKGPVNLNQKIEVVS